MKARRLAAVAIACLTFALAYLIQPAGDNERANYDLTIALARGSPSIDQELREPTLRTIDASRFEGHAYAAKAPGLAAASLPAYGALAAAGVETKREPKRPVWALHLWSVVVPAAILLALVRGAADRVEPGFGTAAMVALGASTLVLPFSTVFFAHVLSAALAFLAFVLLSRAERSWISFAAGALAGLAAVVEYPAGLVGLALVVYAAKTRGRSSAAAFACGLIVGALPALAFNAWAFGDPFRFPYEGWHRPGGEPLPGVFGISTPSLATLLSILFYAGGIAAILVPAAVGAVVLWRRGAQVEAVLPLAIAALFVAFDVANAEPFGGSSPGPRYVIPALPFLALPLAAALRAVPGLTLGLVVPSAAYFAAITVTAPLAALDGEVVHRLRTGGYASSAASLVGIDGGAADAPFVLALLGAALAAVLATPWVGVLRREVAAGVAAAVGWIVLANRTPVWAAEGIAGELTIVAVAALTAGVVVAVYRRPTMTAVARMTGNEP